ncbi:MAG TPA: FhaA domain-containing protein [Chthonomonadaceae bacterium]|nr:FhaA domain-containing protein [Chthonomonadaceae bacterium]
MDLFEKFNRSFGSWYEGLFGGSDDVRPKDILRLILAAIEDNRKEGFDNRVYVPNQYVLEIAVNDEEEKEYLLAFLDRSELEAAIQRCCRQNNYHIRGPLEFTVKEVDDPAIASKRGEKVRVRCRYSTKIAAAPEPAKPARDPRVALPPAEPEIEERTVASIATAEDGDEEGTVAAVAGGMLIVQPPDRPAFRYALTRAGVTIGRSVKSGNDLVIDADTQMSRKHARIERDGMGRYTLQDLKTTNGSFLNGGRVDTALLSHGDEIRLGLTRIVFERGANEAEGGHGFRAHDRDGQPLPGRSVDMPSGPFPRRLHQRAARLVWTEGGADRDDFLLASETLIGRGVTNDIVLPDRSVATRHARVIFADGVYLIESLRSDSAPTLVNGLAVMPGQPMRLRQGDRIVLGGVTLRFEAGET